MIDPPHDASRAECYGAHARAVKPGTGRSPAGAPTTIEARDAVSGLDPITVVDDRR